MKISPDKHLVWLILDHPWQLFLALAIVKPAPGEMRFGLIASKHKYWGKIQLDRYRNHFEKIFFFDEPKRAKNLFDVVRFISQIRRLKTALAQIPIKHNDAILTLCYYTYLESALTRVFPHNRQIFLMRDDSYQVYDHAVGNLKSRVYREAKSSLLHRKLLEPLLGLKKKTRFVWINTPENFHDLILEQRPEAYYDRVFRLRPQTVPTLTTDEVYYPYALLPPVDAGRSKRKRVVFFLSDHIKNPNYYRKISIILQNLSHQFPSDHILELRAHPNRPEEYKRVNAAGWQINNEPGSAEEYLLNHHDELAYAFSHVSTVLLFATQLSIPSYTYYRLFGFASEYQTIFDRIYRDMPQEFFMTDFTAAPRPYVMPVGKDAILNSLNNLYSALEQ